METVKIIKTGYDIVSGKHFAYCENCQFEITQDDSLAWSFKIQMGEELAVEKAWFDSFTGEKYEY